MLTLDRALAKLPLIAILRGVEPDDAVEIGAAIVESGWSVIEVPLNSPRPLESIERLSNTFGETVVVGAGTVLTPEAVGDVERAGGRLIVMPHASIPVIEAALGRGLDVVPGVQTATEAFSALGAGARALKLFPGEAIPPAIVRALRAVLPPDIPLIPTGGIAPDSLVGYWAAGVRGFGIGSALYKPGMSPEQVRHNAEIFATAARRLGA